MVGGLDSRLYVKQLRSFNGGSADRTQRSTRASSGSDKRIRMHKNMTGAQFIALKDKVAASCHIDVIYSGAVLQIDGKKILDNGKLLV